MEKFRYPVAVPIDRVTMKIRLSSWRNRIAVAVLLSLVLSVLAGVGILLANTYGASVVAANARDLHWTNATAGSVAITRASIAQAVFFSFDTAGDLASADDAVSEARLNISATRDALNRPEATPELVDAAEVFLVTGEQTVNLAAIGESSQAEALRTSKLESEFQNLSELLQQRQAVLVGLISESETSYGRVSQLTFVVIAFLIPAITIVVFWFVLRQKMRIRESKMRTMVDKERELNRAKDELIAGLSHELRTPITSILGFSEILLEDPGLQNEAHELIGLINASSSDLSRMVNDLLMAARIDAGALTIDLAQVDIGDEVRAVVTVYRRSGENIEVAVPPLKAYADPLRVRQAIHNLVSNALRHGGSQVVISARDTDRGPVLVVADNGPGLPSDMEGKVFERFAHKGRQAVVAGSVGLGLAICKELAVQMGGDLEYRRIDEWTTFNLRLRPYIGELALRGSAPSEGIDVPLGDARTEVSI